MQRLRTTIFPIDFKGFLKFRGSMLGGKIDPGVYWGILEASEGILEASWGILKLCGGVLRRLRAVWRRFEASNRPPERVHFSKFSEIDSAAAALGGSLVSSQRHPCSDPRLLRGIQLTGSSLNPHTLSWQARWRI